MSPITEHVAAYGPVFGLAGVAGTLALSGLCDDRQRRRQNHARAIEAVIRYYEMPFRTHRRRHEPEHASDERARLSDEFSVIQAELASSEALIRADPDLEVRDAYEALVNTLRSVAGKASSDAWAAEPIERDDQVGNPALHIALAAVRSAREHCETIMACSTRPRSRGSRP